MEKLPMTNLNEWMTKMDNVFCRWNNMFQKYIKLELLEGNNK